MTARRSPYLFLPPLRCVACGDVLSAKRQGGHCQRCRKTRSALITGRQRPTDWGTARAREVRLVLWHELTGETLADPYADGA